MSVKANLKRSGSLTAFFDRPSQHHLLGEERWLAAREKVVARAVRDETKPIEEVRHVVGHLNHEIFPLFVSGLVR